jgi:outer membrane lipoprotein-sorting protein
MRIWLPLSVALLLLLAPIAAPAGETAAPATAAASAGDPSIAELLDGVDDANRGTSSEGRMTMSVKTSRWERSITMDLWSRGEDHSLLRIISPAKEAGMATLRVGDNIWNYLPKVDRTMKVPAAMMSGNWMGSHFTNNDLVHSSRFADDFTSTITQRPTGPSEGSWVIESIPNEDAPVIWGKVVITVSAKHRIGESITYWDEDGTLVRTMSFSDVQMIGGRPVPMKMRMVPADAKGEFTEIVYDRLRFDVDLPDSIFTLQSIRRR